MDIIINSFHLLSSLSLFESLTAFIIPLVCISCPPSSISILYKPETSHSSFILGQDQFICKTLILSLCSKVSKSLTCLWFFYGCRRGEAWKEWKAWTAIRSSLWVVQKERTPQQRSFTPNGKRAVEIKEEGHFEFLVGSDIHRERESRGDTARTNSNHDALLPLVKREGFYVFGLVGGAGAGFFLRLCRSGPLVYFGVARDIEIGIGTTTVPWPSLLLFLLHFSSFFFSPLTSFFFLLVKTPDDDMWKLSRLWLCFNLIIFF